MPSMMGKLFGLSLRHPHHNYVLQNKPNVDFFEVFLVDLAHIEWLRRKSYLAANYSVIDIQALQSLDHDKLFNVKFKINPSCFLLTSNYNLLGKINVDKLQKRTLHFITYRQNLVVKTEEIPKSEFYFINGIKDDLTLYEVYEKYNHDIKSCLEKFLANGVLCEFVVG